MAITTEKGKFNLKKFDILPSVFVLLLLRVDSKLKTILQVKIPVIVYTNK